MCFFDGIVITHLFTIPRRILSPYYYYCLVIIEEFLQKLQHNTVTETFGNPRFALSNQASNKYSINIQQCSTSICRIVDDVKLDFHFSNTKIIPQYHLSLNTWYTAALINHVINRRINGGAKIFCRCIAICCNDVAASLLQRWYTCVYLELFNKPKKHAQSSTEQHHWWDPTEKTNSITVSQCVL